MNDDERVNECTDPTQNITVELPCAMVERVEKLASEKHASLSNILIEALDNFLRRQG